MKNKKINKIVVVNLGCLLYPRITGIQRVAIEWSRQLKKRKKNVIFVAPKGVLHPKIVEELEIQLISNFTKHHLLWEQIELRFYLIRRGFPLLISFGNTGVLGYSNQITTIHDLAFKFCPKGLPWKYVQYHRLFTPLFAKKSNYIFTVSQTSKFQIAKTYKIPSAKIHLFYNGLSNIFRENSEKNTKLRSSKYILTVSSHHPNKNFRRLVEAFKKSKSKHEYKLCIIGTIPDYIKKENDWIKRKHENVEFLENISDEALVSYYKNASLFVFPSLHEGFGLPIIEAMSQGVSCAVSDIPIFREICQDKVVYFDPLEVEDISHTIDEILSSNLDERRNAEARNYVLEKFSWEKGGEKMAKFLDGITN